MKDYNNRDQIRTDLENNILEMKNLHQTIMNDLDANFSRKYYRIYPIYCITAVICLFFVTTSIESRLNSSKKHKLKDNLDKYATQLEPFIEENIQKLGTYQMNKNTRSDVIALHDLDQAVEFKITKDATLSLLYKFHDWLENTEAECKGDISGSLTQKIQKLKHITQTGITRIEPMAFYTQNPG